MEAAGKEGGEAVMEDREETHLGDMTTKEMSTTAKDVNFGTYVIKSCNAIINISQNKICRIY